MVIKYTFLLPCLNEEETLLFCIKEIQNYIQKNKLNAEILLSDNNSDDNSVQIAKKNNCRVTICKEKGYGNTLIHGTKNAHGKYCIMGDCDGSVKGKKYFECHANFGIFVRPNYISVGDYPPIDDFNEKEDEI